MSSLLEVKLELRKLSSSWRLWSERIAKAAKDLLGSCEVYVFGSAAEGRVTGGSDVDILIVCGQLPRRCKSRGNIKAEIEEAAELPLYHPFEIHLVDETEADWYLKHAKKMIRINPK